MLAVAFSMTSWAVTGGQPAAVPQRSRSATAPPTDPLAVARLARSSTVCGTTAVHQGYSSDTRPGTAQQAPEAAHVPGPCHASSPPTPTHTLMRAVTFPPPPQGTHVHGQSPSRHVHGAAALRRLVAREADGGQGDGGRGGGAAGGAALVRGGASEGLNSHENGAALLHKQQGGGGRSWVRRSVGGWVQPGSTLKRTPCSSATIEQASHQMGGKQEGTRRGGSGTTALPPWVDRPSRRQRRCRQTATGRRPAPRRR